MSEKLGSIKIQEGPDGELAVINGKTYTLLRGYKVSSLNGWFWLAVAGRIPLKKDDLADKWLVTRAGDVYIAYAARPFSYFLLDDTTDKPSPENDRWPNLKSAANAFAFVAPNEDAAKAQLRLVLEQYRSTLDADEVLGKATWAVDQAGGDVKALVIPARHLDCQR
jgi:hypothetical protein